MPLWTKEDAFETAIVDGINQFVRDVLASGNFLIPEKAAPIALPPITELKYRLARELARKWAKMTFVDGDVIGSNLEPEERGEVQPEPNSAGNGRTGF